MPASVTAGYSIDGCASILHASLRLPDVQLELRSGILLDTYSIEDDCVDITANHGAYLFDDLLAVLAVRFRPQMPT